MLQTGLVSGSVRSLSPSMTSPTQVSLCVVFCLEVTWTLLCIVIGTQSCHMTSSKSRVIHGFSIGWVLSLWIRNWILIFSFWWGIWSALGLLINSCRGRLSRGAWQADCQVGHSVSLLPRHAGIMHNFSNYPFLSIAFAVEFSLFDFSFAGHDCGIIRLDMGFEESHSRQEDCCSEYTAHAVCPSSWHFSAAEVMRAL